MLLQIIKNMLLKTRNIWREAMTSAEDGVDELEPAPLFSPLGSSGWGTLSFSADQPSA